MLSAMLAVRYVHLQQEIQLLSHTVQKMEMSREGKSRGREVAEGDISTGGWWGKYEVRDAPALLALVASSCRKHLQLHHAANVPSLAADPLVQRRCTAARTHGLAAIGNRAAGRAISLVLGDMAAARSRARKSFPPAPPPLLVRGELQHDRTIPAPSALAVATCPDLDRASRLHARAEFVIRGRRRSAMLLK